MPVFIVAFYEFLLDSFGFSFDPSSLLGIIEESPENQEGGQGG